VDSKSKNKIGITLIALIAFLTCVTKNSYSQDVPVVSVGKLKFYFDTNSFRGKTDTTYQEFYLMLFADQIADTKNNITNKTSLNISTKILNPVGNLLSTREWVTEVIFLSDSTQSTDMITFDQWGEFLLPGKYDVSVSIAAENNPATGSMEAQINVKEMNEAFLNISDIQFIFKTEEVTENPIFAKAGKNVFPNVWRRYGVLNPKLTFYYEIYEIDTTIDQPLLIDYNVYSLEQKPVKRISNLEIPRTGKERSVIHAIDISTLPSAVYELEITVSDSYAGKSAKVNKNFEVVQLDRLQASSNLSEDDIKMFDELFSYIAEDSEYRQYKKLNDSEKGNFIINFWKSKDPNPTTQENEYLLSVIEKFNYANNNFSWADEPGWKSDRGRVLIKYGMPTNIESHQSEPNTIPYEIWTYQLERNYNFVFADRRANGRYMLIHSEMVGEVSDPTWINLIRK
jgi:GWxTD domain-containing protein